MKTGAYVPSKAAALPAKRNTLSRTGHVLVKTGRFLTRRTTIVEIICFLYILLFVYAAVSKLIDYQKFRVQLGQSPILTAYSGWVAIIIPLIEILISAMILFRRFRLIALYSSFSLMVGFTTYIVAILKFSDFIPCSCGGILQSMTWNQHLIFNTFFVALGAFAILIYPSDKHN